jgi:hypothetical protein
VGDLDVRCLGDVDGGYRSLAPAGLTVYERYLFLLVLRKP